MPVVDPVAAKRAVFKHHKVLTSGAYLASFICLCIFPSFDRRTEIEEHALIAGYAWDTFNGEWAGRLHSAIKRIESSPGVLQALDREMHTAGLVPHRMNFTTDGGIPSSLLYTVASSRRGDSREACVLVFATNWTSGSRDTTRASWGVGVGVVLAQFLKTVPWLSKDIIFVFVDSTLPYGAGARAWLQAYFGGSSAVRRGVLRQAAVLDTISRPASVLLEAEGINGMVPNQDIVNSYMVGARNKRSLAAHHRATWESLRHTFMNGGVHSQHAPFLELSVPAFTILARKGRNERGTADPVELAQSLEGLVRSMSNVLQQLHHSFNFYFFTGRDSHISNGLYLYPVFAMQLPLLSFLMTTPAFRDIRSFLVGLGAIAAVAVAVGSPAFLLATNSDLAAWLATVAPGVNLDALPPACLRPEPGGENAERRRRAAASWLTASFAAAMALMFGLRRYAFAVFDPGAPTAAAGGGDDARKGIQGGVRLPSPLWDAIRCSSGFAGLAILAPITIYSWALSVPLTVVLVPTLVLVRPLSFRRRPIRSLATLLFLAANAFFLAARPEVRRGILGDAPSTALRRFCDFFDHTVVPAVPRNAHKYLPTPLVRWLQEGKLGAALDGDFLLGLYEVARDFNCVGGMLFPVFCFLYMPVLVLVALVAIVLPAQRVEDEGLTLQTLRLGAVVFLSLIGAMVVGGVYWRSLSSSGFGQMQW